MSWFSSSKNPQEISLTVKSTLLALVPIVVGVSHFAGVNVITEEWLKEVVDSVAQIVIGITTILSAVGVLWGLIRKFF